MERKAKDHPAPQPPSPSDGDLVAKALKGDRTSFDELIRRYQRQAMAVSYRLLGNTHDAMEVTQNAFLKSFTSLASLQKGDAFGGWLMRIVSNLSLNFRRGRKTRSQVALVDLAGGEGKQETDFSAHGGDPLHNLQSVEMGQRLQWALKQLPEKQRLAIVMFTIEGMPQKDIADALECSVEAIKWHVFQGRKKLREMLKEHLDE